MRSPLKFGADPHPRCLVVRATFRHYLYVTFDAQLKRHVAGIVTTSAPRRKLQSANISLGLSRGYLSQARSGRKDANTLTSWITSWPTPNANQYNNESNVAYGRRTLSMMSASDGGVRTARPGNVATTGVLYDFSVGGCGEALTGRRSSYALLGGTTHKNLLVRASHDIDDPPALQFCPRL